MSQLEQLRQRHDSEPSTAELREYPAKYRRRAPPAASAVMEDDDGPGSHPPQYVEGGESGEGELGVVGIDRTQGAAVIVGFREPRRS